MRITNLINLDARMQINIEANKDRMASLTDEIFIKIITEDKKHFQYIANCANISMNLVY